MMRTLALIAYPVGMAAGQAMFKVASADLRGAEGASLMRAGLGLALNPWFIAAVALYGLLSVGWVWILAGMPLSTAYPFVALAFVITPLLGHFLFGEALGWNHIVGLVLLTVGLTFILR